MPIRTDSVSSLPKFELPIVIPVFNGVTYLSNTIDFFKARGFDEYLILNNGSAYPPLEEYLSKVPDGVTVLDREFSTILESTADCQSSLS
jgi:hypothetical protein